MEMKHHTELLVLIEIGTGADTIKGEPVTSELLKDIVRAQLLNAEIAINESCEVRAHVNEVKP